MSRNPNHAPAKSKSPLPFIIIGAVLVAVIAAVLLMSRQSANSNSSTQATRPGANAIQQPRQPLQPGAANPYSKGGASARVTLEEFSDFQCPACGGLPPGGQRGIKQKRHPPPP